MTDCRHGLEETWCALCLGTAAPVRQNSRARRLSDWGSRVEDALNRAVPGQWISTVDLMAATGLDGNQISAAVAYLRENVPNFSLVSSAQGYQFTSDPAIVQAYRLWRVRTAQTTVRRLWHGVLQPYVTTTASSAEVRLMTRQFERMLEDLEDLMV